jgi:MoxR-like ATPase
MEIRMVSLLGKQVIGEVERAVVGKHDQLVMVMASTLAGGHVLLEDYPGLGKTLIADWNLNAYNSPPICCPGILRAVIFSIATGMNSS